MNIDFRRFLMMFTVLEGSTAQKLEESKKFMTLRAYHQTTFKSEDRYPVRRENFDEISLTQCENMINNVTDNISEAFKLSSMKVYRGAAWCSDIKGLTQSWLQGTSQKDPYTRMRFLAYPCSLEDAAQCASSSRLEGSSINNPAYLMSADYSNYSHPVKGGINTDFSYPFGVNTRLKVTYWLKESKVFSKNNDPDSSFIELDKVTSTIGTRNGATHCSPIQIEDGSCDPYLEIEIRPSKTQSTIQRRYSSFPKIMANIGGIFSLTLCFSLILLRFYNSYKKLEFIREQLYGELLTQVKESQQEQEDQELQNQIIEAARQEGRGHQRRLFKKKAVRKFNRNYQRRASRFLAPRRRKNGLQKGKQKDEEQGKNLKEKFDFFQFFEASRRANILSTLYLDQEYMKVLIPHIFLKMKKLQNKKNLRFRRQHFLRKKSVLMRMVGQSRRVMRLGQGTVKFNKNGKASVSEVLLTGLEAQLQSFFYKILGREEVRDDPAFLSNLRNHRTQSTTLGEIIERQI